MRYPEFIKPGDTIGFIAPSFGCTIEPYLSCFEAAVGRFEKMGFKTRLGPNCFAAEGVGKSNTPAKCGSEVNAFLGSGPDIPDLRAVISCGGGETMCEDLPYIDFDDIRAAVPRWFMGYSDNTNLTFTLPVLCDTAAIYGPNAPSFGMERLHNSLVDALSFLRGEKLAFDSYPFWEKESLKTPETPFEAYNLTEPASIRTVSCDGQFVKNSSPVIDDRSVIFSGRMIGGCLDCLINLAGTPWDNAVGFCERYASDGIIWFLESCDLTPMGIRRALWQLESNGWFRHVSGFIIGRPFMYDDRFGSEGPREAVLSILGGHGVPIILDADLGHLPPAMPFISGAYATVRAARGTMHVDYSLI